MRRKRSVSAILQCARPDADASFQFQCNEKLIYVHNSYGRVRAYIGWTIAAFLAALPLVRVLVPGETWFAFDERGAEGWFGLFVYLLVIVACASAGFQSSTVRVNVETQQIQRTSQWGPFRMHTVTPLAEFREVRLVTDSEGDMTVALSGSRYLQVVWGRSRKESIRIARELARCLALPLAGVEGDAVAG